MAKSHERVIVDVRDLFGQAKEKVDLPELDEPRKAPTPGGGLSQVGWGNGALGEYKPKVCSTGNGDVFFGGPGGPPSTGRRRQAPRAPVMIDMDVGIDEQLSGSRDVTDPPAAPDPPRPEGPWSFGPPVAKGGADGSRRRGQLGPSDDDGTSRVGASSGSAAGGGVNINAHSVMNGRAPGRPTNKYEGRPLPAPPPPPPPPQPPAANNRLKTTTTTTTTTSVGAGAGGRVGAKDVTTGRVSNVSLGAKTPTTPSHHPGGGRAAVGGGTGGTGGGGGRANSQASLDRSSSGVETDENSTPNGTIQTHRSSSSAPDRGRPAAPSQPPPAPQAPPAPPAPPAPTVLQSRDSSYHSVDDDSDDQTIIFDDEDEEGLVEGGRKQLFVEYHGDDYGQFLNEDQVADPGVAPRGRKKRQRRKKKDGEVAPGSTVSSTENDTVNKKRTLKGRLAAVFMGSINGSTQKAQPEVRHVETGSTIHTFSFADSKIGNYMQGPAGESLYGTTSGSGPELAQCDSAYGGDRKWWNTDTLSARTLASNSDVMLRSRRASTANGDNFHFQSKPNPDPAINGSDDGVETGGGMDFESQRKSVIYGVHTDPKSKNRSIFRRFKKDANPGVASLLDNTVTNPLTAMEGEANNTRF